MDDLEFDLLYPNDEDLPEEWEIPSGVCQRCGGYGLVPLPCDHGFADGMCPDCCGNGFANEDLPEEWEIQLANAEPHNITVAQYVGYGDDSEEREIEVEVRPNSHTSTEVFG